MGRPAWPSKAILDIVAVNLDDETPEEV